MSFHDDLLEDLDNAYFDIDEFATLHTIDGKEIPVVVTTVREDESKTSYGLMKATLNPKESAINKGQFVLYAKESDIRSKVTANSLIDYDGKKMFVYAVVKTEGVLKLTIGKHAV